MTTLDGHYSFRKELTERLQRDILGPLGGEHEVLTEAPATTYITGVLYPQSESRTGASAEKQAEQDVDLTEIRTAIDETPESGVAMANKQMPSAMGITVAVDTRLATQIKVEVTAAVYEPIDQNDLVVAAYRAVRRTIDGNPERWRRRPLQIAPVTVRVDKPSDDPVEVERDLVLRIRVRQAESDGSVAVTATLVNAHVAGRNDVLDQFCVFQPTLRVRTEGSSGLVERRQVADDEDEELLTSRMLHRHAPMFATGHGCAADWAWSAPGPGELISAPATDAVWTAFVPAREVLLTDSNPAVAELRMIGLSNAPETDVIRQLTALINGYGEWIGHRAAEADLLGETEYAGVAQIQIRACEEVHRRMRNGIGLLKRDPQTLLAFRRANEAMALQRSRTQWIRNGRIGDLDPGAGRWRPFQIGFILLCLEGIADRNHDDRGVADLLWFPTGGGKTEAYLGLIAFTTFLRRMRSGSLGGGVTVLMRYTLRLLTLQQFERAATLICAMDTIRLRDIESLGTERMSIGMWVGKAATPNSLQSAADSLTELAKGRNLQEENPVQLRACPWCGHPLDHNDYQVDVDAATMAIRCRNRECEFHTGLPVHVVDEDVYAVRPTLVIATADKFAQVAWRDNVAALFNRSGDPSGVAPPELIVQDELHLISGPLGTLAGLYETVVDIAADRPKIIASTATIRRANEQGQSLFDRKVTQFPPAGLDSRDSWFSVEAPRESKASRQYVGLFAPSTSQATLLIRTYAALLHHAMTTPGEANVRDAYWTLVGYFNSLRLLSAAELQLHADVTERLRQLATRDAVTPRSPDVLRELTSRVDSSDIPSYLRELFVSFPDDAAIDVVLATNMISVGVDVDRLGLMAVMGQPQTTAEYIQTTSRVGRRDPGLVVTMLNSTRSRDRSHYENFIPYHSALYRQVESTSVTPFAARARDRALHAVLVGLLRMMYPQARPNDAAARVEEFMTAVELVKDQILDRVRNVDREALDSVRVELARFIEHWRRLAESGHLKYEAEFRKWPGQTRQPDAALLSSFAKDDDLIEATPTMWSLRDVDVESDLYLES